MAEPRKVIYVDFAEKRRSRPFSLGGGPRFTVGVFFVVLLALTGFCAYLWPQWLTTGFFAPTVIVLAVLATLGAKKAVIAFQMARLSRTPVHNDKKSFGSSDDRGGRTLH